MDRANLESLIEAIEVEQRMPSASTANLARLVARFFRGLIATDPVADNSSTNRIEEISGDITGSEEGNKEKTTKKGKVHGHDKTRKHR